MFVKGRLKCRSFDGPAPTQIGYILRQDQLQHQPVRAAREADPRPQFDVDRLAVEVDDPENLVQLRLALVEAAQLYDVR